MFKKKDLSQIQAEGLRNILANYYKKVSADKPSSTTLLMELGTVKDSARKILAKLDDVLHPDKPDKFFSTSSNDPVNLYVLIKTSLNWLLDQISRNDPTFYFNKSAEAQALFEIANIIYPKHTNIDIYNKLMKFQHHISVGIYPDNDRLDAQINWNKRVDFVFGNIRAKTSTAILEGFKVEEMKDDLMFMIISAKEATTNPLKQQALNTILEQIQGRYLSDEDFKNVFKNLLWVVLPPTGRWSKGRTDSGEEVLFQLQQMPELAKKLGITVDTTNPRAYDQLKDYLVKDLQKSSPDLKAKASTKLYHDDKIYKIFNKPNPGLLERICSAIKNPDDTIQKSNKKSLVHNQSQKIVAAVLEKDWTNEKEALVTARAQLTGLIVAAQKTSDGGKQDAFEKIRQALMEVAEEKLNPDILKAAFNNILIIALQQRSAQRFSNTTKSGESIKKFLNSKDIDELLSVLRIDTLNHDGKIHYRDLKNHLTGSRDDNSFTHQTKNDYETLLTKIKECPLDDFREFRSSLRMGLN